MGAILRLHLLNLLLHLLYLFLLLLNLRLVGLQRGRLAGGKSKGPQCKRSCKG